ncbi:MAG: hypothetical protein IAI49_07905 [Candidatus Eremiobacteraeota bacterium]|nr:hypothetical protein [Candidatus Eremiobacteraeota bacterium]
MKHFPRLAAAALFAATASTAVVVGDATRAGAPAQGLVAAAPQQADAAVFIGARIGVGPNRYYRYAYRGGSWVRLGFYYGSAPGYIPGGYYVGYGPPVYGYGYYGHPYWRPYYAHPYYGPRYYGRAYYGGRGYGGAHVHVGLSF